MCSDPTARFIDHDRKRTMLGRAVMAVVLGCADRGDGENLESAFRELFATR
ncbi:hypothetical protein [Spirillospora sp. NPDC047279]|uniref:hypothetical protein n=1 Tax=Spirillospora sp. NPDC047279 TaxID=3155478 RepID=UPI0033E4D041